MIMKVVGVELPNGSKKKVRFNTDGKNDVNSLREALTRICENDEAVKAKIQKSKLIFQAKDKDLDDFFDIEEGDAIEDKSFLKVIFYDTSADLECTGYDFPPSVLSTSFLEKESSFPEKSMDDIPMFFESGEKLDDLLHSFNNPAKKLKLLPDQPAASNNGLSQNQGETGQNGSVEVVRTSKERVKKTKPKSITMWDAELYPDETPPPSVFRLPEPVPLPTFSHTVTLSIKTFGVTKSESVMNQECASHLLSLTNNRPSQTEYEEYARTIVGAYPDLAVKNASKSSWNCFKNLLTKSIRNRRFAEKRSKAKKLTQGKSPSLRASVETIQNSTVGHVAKAPAMIGYNVGPTEDAHLAELKRVGASGDKAHTKQLVKETKGYRKHWLLSDSSAKNFTEICDTWPHLKSCEVIVYDFFISFDYQIDTVEESFLRLVRRLITIYNEEKEPSDAKIMLLFQRLQKELNGKAKNKGCVITVEEAGKSLSTLTPQAEEPARLVVYYADDIITDAFLLLLGGKLPLEEPYTPFNCVVTLQAAYYAFDMVYPEAYLPMLATLENFVLGTEAKYHLSTTALKIRRSLMGKE